MQDDQLSPAGARKPLAMCCLKRYGKLPSTESVRDYLAAKFKTELDQYQLMRARPARILVWYGV